MAVYSTILIKLLVTLYYGRKWLLIIYLTSYSGASRESQDFGAACMANRAVHRVGQLSDTRRKSESPPTQLNGDSASQLLNRRISGRKLAARFAGRRCSARPRSRARGFTGRANQLSVGLTTSRRSVLRSDTASRWRRSVTSATYCWTPEIRDCDRAGERAQAFVCRASDTRR